MSSLRDSGNVGALILGFASQALTCRRSATGEAGTSNVERLAYATGGRLAVQSKVLTTFATPKADT